MSELQLKFENLLKTEPTKDQLIEFCTEALHEENHFHEFVEQLETVMMTELGEKKTLVLYQKAEELLNRLHEEQKKGLDDLTKEELDELDDIFDSL